MNFLQVPDHVWRHSAKLSGLQFAILCDAWTWEAQGKPARRSNDQLAEMFGATSRAVTKSVKRLEELGLVTISYAPNHIRLIHPERAFTLNERSPRTIVHPEQSFTPPLNDRSPLPRTTVHPSPEQSFTLVENREENKEEKKVEKGAAPKKQARPKSLDDVIEAFEAVGSDSDQAERFWNHYESNGWKVGGRSAMKDWKAAARNWLKNVPTFSKNGSSSKTLHKPNIERILKMSQP